MSTNTRKAPLRQVSPEDLALAGHEFAALAFAAADRLALTSEAAAAFADGPDVLGDAFGEDSDDDPRDL